MSEVEVTGDLVFADRKERKMSRSAYATFVGLTPTKINNIEKGRAPTEAEANTLRPFLTGQVPIPPPVQPSTEDFSSNPVILDNGEDEDEFDDDDFIDTGDEVLTANSAPADDTALSSPVSTPVSILPTKYDFKLEGYHISNSELQTFKRCRRKWWLVYYRELRLKRPDVTGPRAIGTRLHLALSAYYSTERIDPTQVLEDTIAFDRKMLSEGTDVNALGEFDKEADLVRAMLEGYLEWIKETGADEGIEVVGNEEVVEVPFGEFQNVVVVLVGKMDLRIRRLVDKARLFLDHKSVANLTTPTKTLHIDEQMLHYHLLEYLAYLQAGVDSDVAEYSMGGIYNMLRKVKRTATANPPFYGRVEVRHNINELRSYYTRVWGEVAVLIGLKVDLDGGADPMLVAYPTPHSNCSWDCDFITVCPMFDDGSAAEELLAEYYEKSDPHDHYYPMGDREDERSQA
jgi:PD-(D/E)XK nuclease superfamily protein